jgi:dihydroorotate dehydrogenase (NAD+) catalytic subunit
MTASGTFGYGFEYLSLLNIEELGAIVTKGTTLNSCFGNPQPRLYELKCGLLNSIGLENPGVDHVISQMCPTWATWKVPIIVNIAAQNIEEYWTIARKLDSAPGVGAIEVNISCPNVKKGGIEFGTDPKLAWEVIYNVRKGTELPVIAKLSPNVTDIIQIAKACQDAGADALCLTNTLRGMAINLEKRKPALGNCFGGLSGPALKPVALAMVFQVAKLVEIPLIGCGGIETGQDALEFIIAGASAIQVGSATYRDPAASLGVIADIAAWMQVHHIERIADIVGSASI